MSATQQLAEEKLSHKPRPRLDERLEQSRKSKELFGNIRDILIIIGSICATLTPVATIIWLFISSFISPHIGEIWERFNGIFGTKVELAPGETYHPPVYHTYPYIARPGDELNVLAMRHDMSLEQVLFINPKLKVNPDFIIADETEIRLRVQATYLVTKNDSIKNICEKYNLPVGELLRANNRKEAYLEVGEYLKIPFFVGVNKVIGYKKRKKKY